MTTTGSWTITIKEATKLKTISKHHMAMANTTGYINLIPTLKFYFRISHIFYSYSVVHGYLADFIVKIISWLNKIHIFCEAFSPWKNRHLFYFLSKLIREDRNLIDLLHKPMRNGDREHALYAKIEGCPSAAEHK